MGLARVRRSRIDQLVEEGNKTAALVQIALNSPDRFIAACQLGITLSTLALGAVGEEAFAKDLAEAVMGAGVAAGFAPHIIAATKVACYVVAFSITAFVQTVFGELIPKTWTFQRPEQVIMPLIWPMEGWCWLATPFIIILNGFTEFVLRLLNVEDAPRRHFAHSEEELKMLVSASHEEGVLEEEEQEMLHSVFDFSDTEASEVMTPRTDMICMQADESIRTFVELALKHGLSRLPVYEEDIDKIFGTVHIRDALRAFIERKENAKVRELTRKILIVPENKNINDLLSEFRSSKTHMAIVVDEYGATRGLVTIEDLLEELVGDIADEHEIVEEYVQECTDGSYLLDAKVALDEIKDRLGFEITDEQFNTIGGHVFGLLGREPRAGDEVGTEEYTLRVEEADRHRIIKVRLIKTPFVCAVPDAESAAEDKEEAEAKGNDAKSSGSSGSGNGKKSKSVEATK